MIDIYKYSNAPNLEKEKKRNKFRTIDGVTMKSSIIFVKAWKSRMLRGMVLVGMPTSFEVLLIDLNNESIENRMKVSLPTEEIVGGAFDGDSILIFTR